MKSLLSFIITAIIITACSSNHDVQTPLALNNGNKWEVTAEMKPHIIKGEQLISEYLSTNATDYKNLANNLEEQTNKLIKSCNMKGPSHDELHKWLVPHINLINKLEKATNNDDADTIIEVIAQSYDQYNAYFN